LAGKFLLKLVKTNLPKSALEEKQSVKEAPGFFFALFL